MIKSIPLSLLILFTSAFLFAQDPVPIDGVSPVFVCEGAFIDDGPNGGPYSGNNYTFTICPENAGDVIQVDFLAFNLATSPNPNNSDFLAVFDGDDTSAGSLGQYFGTDLTGLSNQITGTVNNTSGCLTFQFVSNTGNPNSNPGWEASISCTTPCDSPTANQSFTSPPSINDGATVTVCMGAPITFSGAGSAAGPGFNLETYQWDFADGTADSTSGINVTHSYDEPGEYLVNLSVVDNNGCQSLNLEPLQVLVSTLPDIDLDYDPEVCFGEELVIVAEAEGTTWTALPPQVVAGETYLADGAGFDFSSELPFDFFEPGATVQSADEILSICVNMEHSYLGDLDLWITCPDGTSVELVNQTGGSTNLGIPWATGPVDGNSNVQTLGVGFDYCWSMDPQFGTFADEANQNDQDFISGDGPGTYNDSQMAEGSYLPIQGFDGLIGCPLNGTWTFNVLDNLGADNGYIFEWGINFEPTLYPDVTTFTPTIGQEVDSTWWTGPAIAQVIDEGNTITFQPENPGTYDFTFNTMNSFGCGYDTTITVNIEEISDIQCWPDIEIDCGVPTQIGVDILDGNPIDYDFEWSPYNNLNNTSLQNPNVTNLFESMTYEVNVWLAGHPLCNKTDQIEVNIPGALDIGPDTAICGMQYQLAASSVGLGEWTIPAGLNLVGGANPFQNPNALLVADVPGSYTITYTDTEGLSCPISKDIDISFFDGIEITPLVNDAFCHGECSGDVTITGVGGEVAVDYTYDFVGVDPIGVVGNFAEDVCPGAYTIVLYDDNGCSDSESYFVGEPPAPIIDSVLAIREECQDYCNGSIQVFSDEAVTYSYNGGFTYENIDIKPDLCSASYDVIIKDINGCASDITSTFVSSPTPPEANFTASPLPATIVNPQVTFTNLTDEAVEASWIFNPPEPFGTSTELNPKFIFPIVGVFPVELTVYDSLGCPDAITKFIEIEDVLEIYIPTSFTPNEDGLNDLFAPKGSDIDPSYYFFRVFSRTGEEVYRSFTYPHAWNGESSNEGIYYAQDGVYNWHLLTKSRTTSKKIERTGSVLIQR